MNKKLPFDKKFIEEIAKKYPTPFYLYDEKAIRENARALNEAFSWVDGYKNYFAVKVNPNPYIVKLLKEEGMYIDCSSMAELLLAEKLGYKGEQIMFTSNDTPWQEFKKATELGAIINFDDISYIEYYEQNVGKLPELVSFRYNPGPRKSGNVIIGEPKEAKYGLTYEQIFEAYKIAKQKGVKRFGLHTMVVSNELDMNAHIETAHMMFELASEISEKVGIVVEFINLGGGYGIPYKPTDKKIDLDSLSLSIKTLYEEVFMSSSTKPRIIMEHGRYVTGPYGYFITRVIHKKDTYKKYIGVDGTVVSFYRIVVNKGYHEISVLDHEYEANDHIYDVVGSLCENNDKFAIDRDLPKIEIGDILVVHNGGAHARALSTDYNAKLRPAELLLRENGQVFQIRRAETVDDYFATLDFEGLSDFK